jgi:hypothetical protein
MLNEVSSLETIRDTFGAISESLGMFPGSAFLSSSRALLTKFLSPANALIVFS